MDDNSFDSVLAALERQESGYCANFKGWPLTSAFQPIYSIDHQRVVGHEALIRSPRGTPADIFGRVTNNHEFILLDRLCRTLHTLNYAHANLAEGWLFLNLNYKVIRNSQQFGTFLAPLFKQAKISPSRIVIEILEEKIPDESLLIHGVSYYKELGCLVAIDDFGAGHANFDRIWKINPHEVRRMLPNLVNLIHEAGSLVLVEGVETEDQALIGMDANIDFLQGYYFSRPDPIIYDNPDSVKERFSFLHRDFHISSERLEAYRRQILAPYLTAFRQTHTILKTGVSLDIASLTLLHQPKVLACYLLDSWGAPQGSILHADHSIQPKDARFASLVHTQQISWYRAPHYRSAARYQEQLQISSPYLSLSHHQVVITLSISLTLHGDTYILCCDLDLMEDWLDQDKHLGQTGQKYL